MQNIENLSELQKEFVNYNQALKLKALGFDEPCFGSYVFGDELSVKYSEDQFITESCCLAPTYSQAFRWFRAKYELTWEHSFDDSQIQLYVGEIAYPDNCLDFFKSIEVKYDCYNKAFEEAELACLDKLIEIVEKRK